MKKYSTPEMISKIMIGQKASMVAPVEDIVIKATSEGFIVEKDGLSTKHIGQQLPLSSLVVGALWTLEPIEVTFEEALIRLQSGGVIICKYKEEGVEKSIEYTYDSMSQLITFDEIINGQWFLAE